MSEVETPQRVKEQYSLCCCVLIRTHDGGEVPCGQYTSGPDDPFCAICEPRHFNEAQVVGGLVKVSQRLRRKAET
jgi:hypothetical protein